RDQHQQRRAAQQAPQFLDAETPDGGDPHRQRACFLRKNTLRASRIGPAASSGSSEPARSSKPSALEKAPRAMVTKWVAGLIAPITAAPPAIEATGSIMPEYCTASTMVATVLRTIAAIWLLMKLDMHR